MDVTYVGALIAGLLSFLSPCVLPLVPPYLCFLGGTTFDQLTGEDETPSHVYTTVVLSSVAFVLGFTTVFVALGAGASTIGRFLRTWQDVLATGAGIVIILMGLNFLGVIRIPLLSREARFQAEGKPASVAAAYVMGLAFAFGWTPCIGPVLGPILTLAGGRETVGEGALLLFAYSIGLGIPFLVAAVFSGAFMRFMTKFRVHLGRVEKAIGGLLVLAGIFFVTGGVSTVSYWLLETFPALGRLG